MTDQNIFSGDNTNVPPVAPVVAAVPSTPTVSPDVAEYVGVGKKYQSVEEAIKSVPHAQKHIATIEAELKAAKEELTKRTTTAELLEELRRTNTQTEPTAPSQSISQEEIEKLVQRTIGQNEQVQRATNNVESVKANFISKFGDKAEAEYVRIAQESGLSIVDLNRLASTSPNVVFKLAGIDSNKSTSMVNKPTSTVNTEALPHNTDTSMSARVKQGASTKDLLNGWKIAGQKVGKQS